eukprot:15450679-Alexandrium_andersonii.AAC.1
MVDAGSCYRCHDWSDCVLTAAVSAVACRAWCAWLGAGARRCALDRCSHLVCCICCRRRWGPCGASRCTVGLAVAGRSLLTCACPCLNSHPATTAAGAAQQLVWS